MFGSNRIIAIAVVLVALGGAFYWMTASVRHDQSPITVEVHRISPEGVGEKIGKIVAETSGDHVALKPDISGLAPGKHAFHVHENASCEPGEKDGQMVAGLKAGGHYDPHGVHSEHGHTDHSSHDHTGMEKPAGDLPELVVDDDGTARKPVMMTTLTMHDLRGRSFMIHAHGETPEDPELPKGGGARVACGVVPS